tara:strand:+ start:298 stop:594 length:297 start_codon:yes stop_codon:yes gene_type:complete
MLKQWESQLKKLQRFCVLQHWGIRTRADARLGSKMTEGSAKTPFNWSDWIERSVWTAVEAGLAIMVVTDVSSMKAAASAAAAAAIAALKSLAQQRLAR